MTNKSPQPRRRILLVMGIIIFTSTISKLIQTAGPENDFGHFRLIHLAMVFACGLITGALITKFRQQKTTEA